VISTRITRATLPLLLFVVTVLILSSSGVAAVPADSDGRPIPNVTVWDDLDQKASLRQLLQAAGSGPVIVLPIYTHCSLSCPVLTRKLKQETALLGNNPPYRVLLFSFDPLESAQSLRTFRESEQLPAKWILVRTQDAGILQFSDFFHYSILTEGRVLVHPNELFLLEHDLRWRATLVDVSWEATELQRWMGRIESPGVSGWIAMHPDKLAWIGLGGLSFGLAVMLSWLVWRKPSGQSATA